MKPEALLDSTWRDSDCLQSSWGAETAEEQEQDLTVRVAEFQRKLDSLPCHVCYTKVWALIGKEWDPDVWDKGLWIIELKIL